MSKIREWVQTLMPAFVVVLTTLSGLAAGWANMRANRAQDTADVAVAVADDAFNAGAAQADSLRKAYRRIAALEAQVGKLNTPAVRRVIAATRGTVRVSGSEPRKWWKPWTWG